ncbi:MAG: pilus assembly protein PilM [Candidatus Wallbacteria bacterium]
MGIGGFIDSISSLFKGNTQQENEFKSGNVPENNSKILAADFGSSSFKLLNGYKKNGEIKISGLNTVPSDSAMSRISYFENVSAEIEAFKTKIEILTANFSAEADNLIVSLPDNFSFINLISLDKVPSEEAFNEVIKSCLEPDLPHSYNLWQVASQVIDKTAKSCNVITLSTLKKNYDTIVKVMNSVIAEPDYISASAFLAHEAVYPYLEKNAEKNIAVIGLGNVTTMVSIFKGQNLRFMQNVYIGGYNFTLDIANSHHIATLEAESLKRNELFFLPEYAPQQEKIQNFTLIKASFMELMRGIFCFFESYLNKYFEPKIDEIIIYGGGANFKNIDVMMNGLLNMPVRKSSSIVKADFVNGQPLDEDSVNLYLPLIGAVRGGVSNEGKA